MAGKTRISLRLASATALALVLAACGQQNRQASVDNSTTTQAVAALPPLPEVQPLAEGPATPIRYAPRATALPAARQLGYAEAPNDDRYAWIDRADWISDTIGDSPPDYYFDYDGVEPWAWQTGGDYVTYAEPVDDGYRYYYYEPGADYPYLVRDPQYTYGYRDGRIASVYDRQGRYLAAGEAQRQAEAASRYYARARALRAAARGRDRRGVAAAQWAARRPVIAAARTDWREARQRVPDWQAYRQRNAAEETRRLQPERIVRERAAERFASWQREGRTGSPPQLYVPADRGNRDGGARQAEQQPQAQRDVAQQRVVQERQRQQAAQQQMRDDQRAQADARRGAAGQRAAAGQQQTAQRDQARREHVLESQRATEQRGQLVRQQRDAQRQQIEQQRAAQHQAQQRDVEQRGQQQQQRQAQRQQAEQQRAQQQAMQQQTRLRGAEQRGQQMQQQREAQRQQAEQQRAQQRGAQQQQVQQRQQAQQQRATQQAQQQAAQQQQRAAQQAQQRATQRPQPEPGRERDHGNR